MSILRYRANELRQRFYRHPSPGMFGRFLRYVEALVPPGALVLDAGCGRGHIFRYRRGSWGNGIRVVGVDRRNHTGDNPNLNAPIRADLACLPFPDASFDAVICAHVAEHLDDPEGAFLEMARVLRPGGPLLLLTPNRRHYVPLLARLLPHRLHVAVNRRRGVDEHDIIPTLYRANTASRVRELMERGGLAVERLELFEPEPEYLAFHPLAYAAGVAYERLVNRLEALAPLRVSILAVGRRPSQNGALPVGLGAEGSTPARKILPAREASGASLIPR